ncbi:MULTISPECIES: transglycosylase domain-containing protein [unclassified Coleofasciculus]|uniref:transglycosylase domain-containing protein n=1 Tax=unclassified Coleofasciculus TaxID=2692782 RepID=UPI001880552E|nr:MULTISPECIES: penicillin-binding protein 1A [unclassified Coleofasciculus]MBE9124916.1 penicillin-binding protein 1A [Coleofasciculus sp. LEGE 07081]MBE9147839.1 penicillin-binding protein 1A [Coleofasciculus sp. LEGE 07092]
MSSSTIQQKQERKSGSAPIWQFAQGVAQVTGGTVLGITMLASSVVAGGLVGLATSFRNLPDVRVLRGYVPTETTYIYDFKGKSLASLHGEANREVVKLENINPNLKRAVIAIEDSHFYLHHGVNPNSVGRALLVNWERGSVVEGGSTLTMQLVKNLFLNREKRFSRKIAEAVLAVRLEQIFTKDQILEMYLNQIYWGHNNYGIQTAAESYFAKEASELNLAESAMLAGLIQSPEDYTPFVNYQKAKERQAQVLMRMRELGWITAAEEQQARSQPLQLGKVTSWQTSQLPYITEAVVTELNERFGKDAVLKGGMRVQTTIDYNFQKMAEATVTRAHANMRRRGLYADQVALAAVDPRTHFVKALVGGVSYDKSQFNRAIQSRRQPGSAFKPFVYYAAFASGKYSPSSTVMDTPVSYRDGSGWYSPRNYGGGYGGAMTIRTALTQSRNVPAVKIGKAVGLDKVIEVCRTLGIKSPMEPVTSLPLGAIGLTPLEMAGAYATFANNGWHSDPTVIVRVTDSSGNVLLDNTPKPRLILDPWAAASLNSVLVGVINGGTGTAAQIGRQAAGKTGTTSSERDVWFVGYVPQLATAVWIGNDNYRPLGAGATGGGFAAPIWRDFMRQALKNEPVKYFEPPSKFKRP